MSPQRRARPVVLHETGKLQRQQRVRSRRDFLTIRRLGVRGHNEAFTVVARAREEAEGCRVGCVVSRKVGNAVTRNRVKRLIREVFRRSQHQLIPGDYVVVAKPRSAQTAARGLEAFAAQLVPALLDAARRVNKARPA